MKPRSLPIAMTVLALGCQSVTHANANATKEGTGKQEELARLETQWGVAYARRDTGELGRLLAEEFTDVDDQRAATKSEYLAEAAGYTPTSGSIVFSERMVRFYGNAAVSMGRVRWQDEAPDSAGRYMAVYVRRDGRWQAVAFQLTPKR
jgi:hypothetical protein